MSKFNSMSLLLTLVVSAVNCQDLQCLAERIRMTDPEFQRCRGVALDQGLASFCNDTDCFSYFSRPYSDCNFSCDPFTIGCSNVSLTSSHPEPLCLLRNVGGNPNLQACQDKRASEGLTAYCLSEDCAFIESGYSICGFDQCNPIREACNAHFTRVVQECPDTNSTLVVPGNSTLCKIPVFPPVISVTTQAPDSSAGRISAAPELTTTVIIVVLYLLL